MEETRGGRLRLYMKYPKHSAGRAKIVQVCRPKWYSVMAMALRAASLDSGSTPRKGGAAKWEIGSATAQNMRIVPMPAAKSMANHASVECSGRESWVPSRSPPNLLIPT